METVRWSVVVGSACHSVTLGLVGDQLKQGVEGDEL